MHTLLQGVLLHHLLGAGENSVAFRNKDTAFQHNKIVEATR